MAKSGLGTSRRNTGGNRRMKRRPTLDSTIETAGLAQELLGVTGAVHDVSAKYSELRVQLHKLADALPELTIEKLAREDRNNPIARLFGASSCRLLLVDSELKTQITLDDDSWKLLSLSDFERVRFSDSWKPLQKFLSVKTSHCCWHVLPSSKPSKRTATDAAELSATRNTASRSLLLLTFNSSSDLTAMSEDNLSVLMLVATNFLAAMTRRKVALPYANPAHRLQLLRRRLKREARDGAAQPAKEVAGKLVTEVKNCLASKRYKSGARFQKVVDLVLRNVFPSELANCRSEQPVLGGLDRIDLVYRNIAQLGLFRDIAANCGIPCPYIHVECKDYRGTKVSNPEVDQLRGRFSDARGRFGFLVCSKLSPGNRTTLISRCRDHAVSGEGWIIVLDSDDLIALIHARLLGDDTLWDFLDEHFRTIVF